MTKEETHYVIDKLVLQYEKRVKKCSDVWDSLNETDEGLPGEMNSIIDEMTLMEEFIDDLKSLKE